MTQDELEKLTLAIYGDVVEILSDARRLAQSNMPNSVASHFEKAKKRLQAGRSEIKLLTLLDRNPR